MTMTTAEKAVKKRALQSGTDHSAPWQASSKGDTGLQTKVKWMRSGTSFAAYWFFYSTTVIREQLPSLPCRTSCFFVVLVCLTSHHDVCVQPRTTSVKKDTYWFFDVSDEQKKAKAGPDRRLFLPQMAWQHQQAGVAINHYLEVRETRVPWRWGK